MNDWLPFIIASLSFIGSIIGIIISQRERLAREEKIRADTLKATGESYSTLIVALERRVEALTKQVQELETEIAEVRAENDLLRRTLRGNWK